MFGQLFGRPPIASRSLEREFRRVDPSNSSPFSTGGNFNAGIYAVRRQPDERKCVEKCFKPQDIMNRRARFEMFALRELSHKNIVEYLHAFIDVQGPSPRASMYMEIADLGTLETNIQKFRANRENPSEARIWYLAEQLCNAVAYLQEGIRDASSANRSNREPVPGWIGIVHRDIKPANIFMRSDHGAPYSRALLGDFGQAIREDNTNWKRLLQGGDREWSPPEAPDGLYASDCWAVGACIQACCRLGSQPSSESSSGQRGGQRVVGAGSRYSTDITKSITELMHSHPEGWTFDIWLPQPVNFFAIGMHVRESKSPEAIRARSVIDQAAVDLIHPTLKARLEMVDRSSVRKGAADSQNHQEHADDAEFSEARKRKSLFGKSESMRKLQL